MPRTVLLDMRPTLLRPTGVGVVARELARALIRTAGDERYLLFANSSKDRFPAAEWQGPKVAVHDGKVPHRLLAFAWGKLRWPAIETLAGACDVVHGFEPIPLPARRARTVATVHDLFFLRRPELCDPAQTAHLVAGVRKLLPRASHVVTPSEHVRAEVIADLGIDPAKVTAVAHGLTPEQRQQATPEQTRELRKRLRLPTTFILFVGTIEPRKNLARLIEAFARLREQKRHQGAKILVAGQRGFAYQTQEKAIADFNVTTEVRILDYMTAAEIKALMSLARLVVVPSLDEGFALPVVEAMAQGTPVACSRRGAIPEVAGDAALLFDPDELDEMMEAMATGLADEATRQALAEKGRARAARLSWDDAADKVRAIHAALG